MQNTLHSNYRAAFAVCDALWLAIMAPNARETLGAAAYETLYADYYAAAEKCETAFRAWIDSIATR